MIQIYIEAPLASFPRKYANDYRETYQFPPISTVYGCILSFIGELDINAYSANDIKLGTLNLSPEISAVCTRIRNVSYAPGGKRYKLNDKLSRTGVYSSTLYSKPNIKEIVTGTRIVAQVNNPNLASRVRQILSKGCDRFGILSLGNSSAMVNTFREYRESDGKISWL